MAHQRPGRLLVVLFTLFCCAGCGASRPAEATSPGDVRKEQLSESRFLADEIASEGPIVSVRCNTIGRSGDWRFELCDVEHGNGAILKWCLAVSGERAEPLPGGERRCERVNRPKVLTPQVIRRPRYSSRSLDRRPLPTQDPDVILAAVRARYGGSAILEARFGEPPPGWRGTDEPSKPLPVHLRNGRWLYTTVSATALGATSVRPIWEATIVASAVREELHLAGVRGDLIGAPVSVRLPSGKIQEHAGGGVGMAEFGQSFFADDDHTIEERIREAAKTLDLEVRSVDVLHPLQPAPAVVVATRSDPQEFVRRSPLTHELFGGTPSYEAHYVEVRDPAGKPITILAGDFRSGVGMQWIRPDLDDRRKARERIHREG
jgi:hypothetical protein